MPYANANPKSKGKVGNNGLVNQTISKAIQQRLIAGEYNHYNGDSDAYRKKLGLVLSILN